MIHKKDFILFSKSDRLKLFEIEDKQIKFLKTNVKTVKIQSFILTLKLNLK
jgi:hypothetical protein